MYSEHTFNELNTTHNPKVINFHLGKFCSQFTEVFRTIPFLRTLLCCKVFMLSGWLFQLLTWMMFKELDKDYFPIYHPLCACTRALTKSAQSVKLLQRQTSFADPVLCRSYMMTLAVTLGVAALNVENEFCKIHVGYYSQFDKGSSSKCKRM